MSSSQILLLALMALAPACGDTEAEPVAPVAAAAAPVAAEVARIVFIGQAESCDCTRERIDASWTVLSAALEGRDIPVERLQVDVDVQDAQAWRDRQAFMVAPAVFFVDAQEQIVSMLQGELSSEELEELLPAR
jgi:hypothetical protein